MPLAAGWSKIVPEFKETERFYQNMRKDSGFEVMDNINLYVAGNETLEKVVKKFVTTKLPH